MLRVFSDALGDGVAPRRVPIPVQLDPQLHTLVFLHIPKYTAQTGLEPSAKATKSQPCSLLTRSLAPK